MRKLVAGTSTVILSLGLGLATVPTATAASPNAPGKSASAQHSYTASSTAPLIKLASDVGVFSVSASGGTTWDGAAGTLTSEVDGNPAAAHRIIQRGVVTLTKPDGSTMTIKNLRLDQRRNVVTAVTDVGQVDLYDVVQASDTSWDLFMNPEGAAVLREFINLLGLPADGSPSGTITLS